MTVQVIPQIGIIEELHFLPSQALSCAGSRVLSQLPPVGVGTPEIQTVKRALEM